MSKMALQKYLKLVTYFFFLPLTRQSGLSVIVGAEPLCPPPTITLPTWLTSSTLTNHSRGYAPLTSVCVDIWQPMLPTVFLRYTSLRSVTLSTVDMITWESLIEKMREFTRPISGSEWKYRNGEEKTWRLRTWRLGALNSHL